MIVHLFPSQKITVDFVTLINKNFDNEEHIFYIYGNESEEKNKESLDSFSNVHYFDDRFFSKSWKEFYSIAKISNGIIFHSFLLTKKMIMRFQLNRNLFSKAAWFIWGGDLYDIQRNKKLPTRIRLSLEKSLLKKFSYIITNIHGDFNKAIKDFSLSADHLCARYMDQNIFKFDNVKKKNIKKKILVGNSATVSNNHIEILEKLRKFRDEDIEIHVPLSYGDKAYANQVKTIGENFFGSKFIPLMDFMDKENYNRFLETIDIAIFNNDRQQAVGNINGLLFLGA
ncbi:MAG: TDP-N-acetylfucosamine:lipid II N-acetylfucosaminyltransferase, partial [Enterococcus sp.]|nr:TDP-N-acetylfucosamine:lipid II N-acetylfucosaminyltransferase [Enterococcus sp.]